MLPGSYNNNYQLVQTDDHVLIVNEMVHETRIIPLDGRPFPPDEIRQWRGSSRGPLGRRYAVVETRNRRDDTPFRGSSDNMHLTERFTRVADDVLLYEFTVNDPAAFTQPWTVQIPSARVQDELMYEYACHEGNKSMYGILGGARAAERKPRRPRKSRRELRRKSKERTMKNALFALVFAVAAPPAAVRAHHSFASEFDANQPVSLRGTVTKVEFINPHSWIHIEVATTTARRPRGKSKAARRTRCSARASTTTRCPSARRSPSTVTGPATARTE